MRPILENPTEPLNDQSYFECLDGVLDRSKVRTYRSQFNIDLYNNLTSFSIRNLFYNFNSY